MSEEPPNLRGEVASSSSSDYDLFPGIPEYIPIEPSSPLATPLVYGGDYSDIGAEFGRYQRNDAIAVPIDPERASEVAQQPPSFEEEEVVSQGTIPEISQSVPFSPFFSSPSLLSPALLEYPFSPSSSLPLSPIAVPPRSPAIGGPQRFSPSPLLPLSPPNVALPEVAIPERKRERKVEEQQLAAARPRAPPPPAAGAPLAIEVPPWNRMLAAFRNLSVTVIVIPEPLITIQWYLQWGMTGPDWEYYLGFIRDMILALRRTGFTKVELLSARDYALQLIWGANADVRNGDDRLPYVGTVNELRTLVRAAVYQVLDMFLPLATVRRQIGKEMSTFVFARRLPNNVLDLQRKIQYSVADRAHYERAMASGGDNANALAGTQPVWFYGGGPAMAAEPDDLRRARLAARNLMWSDTVNQAYDFGEFGAVSREQDVKRSVREQASHDARLQQILTDSEASEYLRKANVLDSETRNEIIRKSREYDKQETNRKRLIMRNVHHIMNRVRGVVENLRRFCDNRPERPLTLYDYAQLFRWIALTEHPQRRPR